MKPTNGMCVRSGISDIFYRSIGLQGSYIVFLSCWCFAWCGFGLRCFDGHVGLQPSYQGRMRDRYAKDSGDISISMWSMKSAIKQRHPWFKSNARAEIQEAIYHFVNDHGFPAATIEKPQFHNLLTYIMDNSSLIKADNLHLSNKAIMEMWTTSFNDYFVVKLFHLLQSAMTYGRD